MSPPIINLFKDAYWVGAGNYKKDDGEFWVHDWDKIRSKKTNKPMDKFYSRFCICIYKVEKDCGVLPIGL